MIHTIDFKTKTIYKPRQHMKIGEYWPVALDIGYSAVKIMSPNVVACFPSYAKKLKKDFQNIGVPDQTQILYKESKTGELWMVGDMAQDLSDGDQESETELYGRNRYFSEMFQVIARTGIALGIMNNRFGSAENKELFVQTGLPPKYLKNDAPLIKEALSGSHSFQIKIGSDAWKDFSFQLTDDNISVIPQPMGSLFSIAMNKDGRQVSDAGKYFNSNVVIFDPGFGTLDTFYIKNKIINSYETFDNYGMKEILERTSQKIFQQYSTEIPVPSMQKYLKKETIRILNRKERKTKDVPFADLLEEASKEVCDAALEKICSIYNTFMDIDYLIITGGTSDAWKIQIMKFFEGMETLKVVSGNQNDDLPSIFNNVRGYYMYSYGNLKRKQK